MINVFVYGLDQFVVGELSSDVSSSLAKLFEVSEDDVNFYAPNNMVFHNGVEQTSWHVLIEIKAPSEIKRVQSQICELFKHSLLEVAIHLEIVFYFYNRSDRVIEINNDYPRYLNEENMVNVESDYEEDMKEGEGDDEIFTGDIFGNFDPE